MLQGVSYRDLLALLLIAVLLGSNALLSYRTLDRQREYQKDVQHASDFFETISSIRLAMRDVERGQRGFLITGKEEYLEPYTASIQKLEKQIERLDSLTLNNAFVRTRFRLLTAQIAPKLQELALTIETRRKMGFDAARQQVMTGVGAEISKTIASLIEEMNAEERTHLANRTAISQSALLQTARSTMVTSAGTFLMFVIGMILLSKNIAARSTALRELAEQRNFLGATLSSIVEGVFVTDSRGSVSYMNPMAENMAGVDLEAVRGLPIGDVMDLRDARSGRSVESTALKALRAGAMRIGSGNRILVDKNGKSIAIEDTAVLLREDDGKLKGAVLAVRDVTMTRANEQRVKELLETERETSDRLREIAAAAATLNAGHSRESVVDVLKNEATRILEATTTVSFGESEPPSAPGRLCEALVGANGRVIGHVVMSGGKLTGERSERDLALLTQLARVASVAIENSRLVEELNNRDRRKDEFLATLAHELRNPLAPLKNAVQILRTPDVSDAASTSALAAIDRQLELLIRLVDDLLDVSRITRGKISLKRETIDLADVVGRALEITRAAVTASGHTLVVHVPSERVLVDADPIRLEQVLANLLHNAAKYTEKSGHIWLTCSLEGDEIVISVRDDGIGIQPEMLEHIFDMFWQHEHAMERAQGGLGIGLRLVRQIVDLHGWRIEARSDGLGRGSEFVVRLPRDTSPPGKPDVLPSPVLERVGRPLGPMKVLVVDDNKDSAESLAILLRLRGHEVRVAHDGLSALVVEEEFRPVLVILDIGLPQKNGYDVAIELRSRRGGALSIVAMTGFGQPSDRRRSHEAGFDHHMVKPIDADVVLAILASPEPA